MDRSECRINRWPATALAAVFLTAAVASAQQVGPFTPAPDPAAEGLRRAGLAAAPHVAERFGAAPLAELGAAAVEAADRLAELRAWNEAHRSPRQNGFVRPLPAPRRVDLAGSARGGAAVAGVSGVSGVSGFSGASGVSGVSGSAGFSGFAAPFAEGGGVLAQTTFTTVAWGGKVHVAGAYRLRLHLSRVELPAGARLWVHGAGRTAGPFGVELMAPDGGLWTPIVDGEELALDVESPAAALAGGSYGFTVDAVVELLPESGPAAADVLGKDTSCEVDASCFGSGDFAGYAAARHAVARLFFVDGHSAFDCTGQLLNDAASDGIPYLLTANHCISTPAAAATLEAVFDDYTASCKGAPPDASTLPVANGSTLLATGDQQSASDFSLLRLANLPAGRTFLGWDATVRAAADGALLYRLSNAGGGTQVYSVTKADSREAFCTHDLPLSRFIYSDLVVGAASPGSSGGAAMLANGQVVGQLFGGCGDSNNPCDPQEHAVDGAFSASFPQLKPFLAQGGGTRCVPGPFALCLDAKRFQVQATWANQFSGAAGVGHAIGGTDEAGYFYFTDPSNYELIVKILNFGTVFKVFYGELTNLQFILTITDTHTGAVKTYTNSPGDCGGLDESAFAGNAAAAAHKLVPPNTAGTCAASPAILCLRSRRFAVSVNWMNQFSGASGAGKAKSLSDLSGLFAFSDPSDVEIVLKVVPFPDRIAFFYAALSDLAYDITVTDTVNGEVKTYHNAAGTYCGGLDNNAFPP